MYAHLDRDLSGPKTNDQKGRHPLPDPDTLKRTLGLWGVAEGVQVVAYDQDNGMYASRLWWLLRYLGHSAVAVLDGGLTKWTREGRPAASGVDARAPRPFAGTPRDDTWLKAADVERLVGQGLTGIRLIDARSNERYRGLGESLDPVAGHIPGAVSHFFKNNLSPDGTFLERAQLKDRLELALGSTPADRAVIYCGSGVSACHNLLALEHAGLSGARLYVGSWSEWCSDPKRPVARGLP